jgi:hypothetical protein
MSLNCARRIKFSDVTNRYIYVLFGFFAQLYIVASTSLYFSIQEQFQESLGISKETVINYFSFFSIIFLLLSLSLKWTWPIKIEEALIVIFIWILLRNLLPKDCLCCNTDTSGNPIVTSEGEVQEQQVKYPSPPHLEKENEPAPLPTSKKKRAGEEEQQTENCPWPNFNVVYSILCVIVMLASFMMTSSHYIVSVLFTIVAIVLMIFTTLVPISCNQFNQSNLNENLLKFTLYSIVWFVNRRQRLTELVLTSEYLHGIHILYTYQDDCAQHLLCGAVHHKHKKSSPQNKKKPHNTIGECDEIANFIVNESSCSIPKLLFQKLERLHLSVTRFKEKEKEKMEQQQQKKHKQQQQQQQNAEIRKRNYMFNLQLSNMIKICGIHQRYKERRWFGGFFSWKYRAYDTELLNIFDLTKTLWILNVCPLFLVFVFIEYILILYHSKLNIDELRSLICVVKLMDALYKERDTSYYHHRH